MEHELQELRRFNDIEKKAHAAWASVEEYCNAHRLDSVYRADEKMERRCKGVRNILHEARSYAYDLLLFFGWDIKFIYEFFEWCNDKFNRV